MKARALKICFVLAFRLCFSQSFPSMPQVSAPKISSFGDSGEERGKKAAANAQNADLLSEILSLLSDGGDSERILRDLRGNFDEFSQNVQVSQNHVERFAIDGRDLKEFCNGFFSTKPDFAGDFLIACDFLGEDGNSGRETFAARFSRSSGGENSFFAECVAFGGGKMLAKFESKKILSAKKTGKFFAIRDDGLKVDIVVRIE